VTWPIRTIAVAKAISVAGSGIPSPVGFFGTEAAKHVTAKAIISKQRILAIVALLLKRALF